MPSSWNIIGWLLLGLITLSVVLVLFSHMYAWAYTWGLHYKTRKTPPKEGQCWLNGYNQYYTYYVFSVSDKLVHLRSSKYQFGTHFSWSVKLESWPQYVKDKRLYLESRDEQK